MGDTNDDKHLMLLGEIKAKVDHLGDTDERQGKLLESIDARLRTVEQKAAASGAVSGGVVSVGMALIIEAMRQWVGRGGTNG